MRHLDLKNPDPLESRETKINKVQAGGDVVGRMQAIWADRKKFQDECREAVDRWISDNQGALQTPCPKGGEPHALDWAKSYQASWVNRPLTELVYEKCSRCKDAELGEPTGFLEKAGVMEDLLGATFENWQPRTDSHAVVLKQCREFAARPTGTIILQGNVGVGKTHLAVSMLRAFRQGRIITQNHFLYRLRQTYRDDNAPNPVDSCKDTPFLVLDELGLSTGGRDEFPALYEVLSYRQGRHMPTVLTTNVEVRDFVDVFGDRLADRLATAKICRLKGESWRKQPL